MNEMLARLQSVLGPRAGILAALGAPIGVLMVLGMMVLPLPPLVLDLLFTFNIAMAVMVMMVAANMVRALDFAAFPVVLLLTTLMRLSLNVASTRVVLLQGHTGPAAAGKVIESFGHFLIGGNFAVGLIVFAILVVINFIVVTKGAERIAEVGARFTLDAMPGKQMAVDADLAAGIINEHEAKRRRAEIGQAAEFHGAMDGAIRFTQRDAVAAIIITVINIIAGFAIGVFQHGMTLADSLKTFTILTVGDGVAAAVPSLMVSVAAAFITTRAATDASMGVEMSSQLLVNPRPLMIAASVLAILGLLPGMPHLAFLLLAAASGGLAYLSNHQKGRTEQLETEKQLEEARSKSASQDQSDRIENLLKLDALALEVGYGLIPLVSTGESFLGRVREIRRQIAINLGIVVPPIHVTDNLQLAPREYAILLKGERIAQGELYPDGHLAIDPGAVREQIDGIITKDPTFGMPAVWIRRNADRERALAAGYTVVDPTTVVCTHLSEVIKRYAPELLGRQETRALLDQLAETHPKTVEEATPKVLSLGEVQRVLQALLRERVPIRDLATILEAITDAGSLSRDVNSLAEAARAALSRTICSGLANEQGELVVLTLDPMLEREIADRLGLLGSAPSQAVEPDFGRRILEKIETSVQAAVLSQPVILCSAAVRPHLRRLTERFLPELSVVAHGEVSSNVRLVSVGAIN